MERPEELPVLLSSPLSSWILGNYNLASGLCGRGRGHLAAESLLVSSSSATGGGGQSPAVLHNQGCPWPCAERCFCPSIVFSRDTPVTRAALSLLTEEAVCVGMAVVPMLGALSCGQRGSLALRVCVSQLRAPRSGGAELPKPGTLG